MARYQLQHLVSRKTSKERIYWKFESLKIDFPPPERTPESLQMTGRPAISPPFSRLIEGQEILVSLLETPSPRSLSVREGKETWKFNCNIFAIYCSTSSGSTQATMESYKSSLILASVVAGTPMLSSSSRGDSVESNSFSACALHEMSFNIQASSWEDYGTTSFSSCWKAATWRNFSSFSCYLRRACSRSALSFSLSSLEIESSPSRRERRAVWSEWYESRAKCFPLKNLNFMIFSPRLPHTQRVRTQEAGRAHTKAIFLFHEEPHRVLTSDSLNGFFNCFCIGAHNGSWCFNRKFPSLSLRSLYLIIFLPIASSLA